MTALQNRTCNEQNPVVYPTRPDGSLSLQFSPVFEWETLTHVLNGSGRKMMGNKACRASETRQCLCRVDLVFISTVCMLLCECRGNEI